MMDSPLVEDVRLQTAITSDTRKSANPIRLPLRNETVNDCLPRQPPR
jgi:hypothetical protein